MEALHNQSKSELVKEIIRLQEMLADLQQEVQPEPVLAEENTAVLHQNSVIPNNAVLQRKSPAIPDPEQNYQAIFNASTDAIFVFSREGNIIDTNKSASVLYQSKKEDLVGLSAQEFCKKKRL